MISRLQALLAGAGTAAFAQEARELRITVQFGLSYWPLTVMREQKPIARAPRARRAWAEPRLDAGERRRGDERRAMSRRGGRCWRGTSDVRLAEERRNPGDRGEGLVAAACLPGGHPAVGAARRVRLDRIVAPRGFPAMIVSDNGIASTFHAMLRWQQERGIAWHDLAGCMPQQNGFVESSNGRFRGVFLNGGLFDSLPATRNRRSQCFHVTI